jgi:hypothetical protein
MAAGPGPHEVLPRLKRGKRRLYACLFSRLEFQTLLSGSERGSAQWQQEQVDYTQSFFAGYRFSREEGVALTYPQPDARMGWSSTQYSLWRDRLQPVVGWFQRWSVFLATFDLDQLRRLEGTPSEGGPRKWHFAARQGGADRVGYRKMSLVGQPFKQVFLPESPALTRDVNAPLCRWRVDSYGFGGGFLGVMPPRVVVKSSAPDLWQDMWSSIGVRLPRGTAFRDYQHSWFVPIDDRRFKAHRGARHSWFVPLDYQRRHKRLDLKFHWSRQWPQIRLAPIKHEPSWLSVYQ